MKALKGYKKNLVSFVQVVLFLFLAFGGFLKKIAPPDETNFSYHVGIVSFLVLITLLVVSAVARRKPGPKHRRAWMSVGIVFFALAVLSSFLYPGVLDKYTYPYPPEAPTEVRVKGLDNDLTEAAREWVKDHPLESRPGVLARKLPKDEVWTRESVEHAKMVLLFSYASLVLSLATAIFCLIEANAETR